MSPVAVLVVKATVPLMLCLFGFFPFLGSSMKVMDLKECLV